MEEMVKNNDTALALLSFVVMMHDYRFLQSVVDNK